MSPVVVGRLFAVALLVALLGAPAIAQPVGPRALPAPTPTATDADLKALITTLENDQARNELLGRLKALEAAAAPAAEPEPDLIGEVLETLNSEVTSRLDRVTQSLLGLSSSVGEIPVLASWFLRQTTDPFSRALWWSIASQVGGAVLGGFHRQPGHARPAARMARPAQRLLPMAARRKRRLIAVAGPSHRESRCSRHLPGRHLPDPWPNRRDAAGAARGR